MSEETVSTAVAEQPAAEPAPVEQILVVPTAEFHAVGLFQGCNTNVQPYLERLLTRETYVYKPRPEMEKDPSFKQLIPYVIFRLKTKGGEDRYFVYTRSKKQGEERLHGKRSIGVGGHVSTVDVHAGAPYEAGLLRELTEEVFVNSRHDVQAPAALINDDSNDVGKVHLGIVHYCDIAADGSECDADKLIEARDPDEMVNCGFFTAMQLIDLLPEFETWSQIAIQSLICGNSATSTTTQL